MALQGFILGDTISLKITVDCDISNWKIRAEIWDNSNHSVKLATSNVTGGSDSQIKITDATNGEFKLYVAKGLTTNLDKRSKIEIEVDTDQVVGGAVEQLTIYQGDIIFSEEQISWDSVS